jgi:hypothetical protein
VNVNSKVNGMWINWNFISKIDTDIKTKIIIDVKKKWRFDVMHSDGDA